MLPGVKADLNVLSHVDPDHVMCFGLMKHLIQAGVASISTHKKRQQLTLSVKEIVVFGDKASLRSMERIWCKQVWEGHAFYARLRAALSGAGYAIGDVLRASIL
jgi:hypothetical protein